MPAPAPSDVSRRAHSQFVEGYLVTTLLDVGDTFRRENERAAQRELARDVLDRGVAAGSRPPGEPPGLHRVGRDQPPGSPVTGGGSAGWSTDRALAEHERDDELHIAQRRVARVRDLHTLDPISTPWSLVEDAERRVDAIRRALA